MLSVTPWLLGALLGVRHALEPDHLAAVSTLVTRQQRRGALVGMAWGLGHTLGLLGLGGLLAVLQAQLPHTWGALLETWVGVMLCVLGARSLKHAWRGAGQGAVVLHVHGDHAHVHTFPKEQHIHVGRHTLLLQPLVVGVMHGLAGSGAMVALVMSQQPTVAHQVLYMALFGIGSVVGMGALTGVAGSLLQQVCQSGRAWTGVLAASGLLSVVTGMVWGIRSLTALLG